MLDDRVRAVLARLEEEDARERAEGVARELRSRAVAHTTGQFLLALVSPQTDCEVLELGGSCGYSTIWLAVGVRQLGGRVLSLEADPVERSELPLRQGRAIKWIEEALAPLLKEMSEPEIHRLTLAIRSATGIEAFVWLIDVAGLSRDDATELMRWTARALLRSALADKQLTPD